MTRLFYHHVGIEGSADFEKTVFHSKSIETVSAALAPEMSGEVIAALEALFPTGQMNCWGVPTGASLVIRNLSEGDFVLLLRTPSPGGDIPALCQVDLFLRSPQPHLSEVLWGSPHYPYVFFFTTEHLALLWSDFVEHVGYSPRYQPHGLFSSVDETRLWRYGGVEGYIRELRAKYHGGQGDTPIRFIKPSGANAPGGPHAPEAHHPRPTPRRDVVTWIGGEGPPLRRAVGDTPFGIPRIPQALESTGSVNRENTA